MLRMWNFSFLLNIFELDCAEVHRIVFSCSAKPQQELLFLHLLAKIHGSLRTMSYSLHHKFILILGPDVHLIVELKVFLSSEIQHYNMNLPSLKRTITVIRCINMQYLVIKISFPYSLLCFLGCSPILCFTILLKNVLWLALNGVKMFMWHSYFSANKPSYTA